jgi:cell filamentation protein
MMKKERWPGHSVVYADSAFIQPAIEKLFTTLSTEKFLRDLVPHQFSLRAAFFYGEIDAIHPFREGNSRTLRLFFHGVAHNAGYLADWRILASPASARETLYAARDRAVMHGDSAPLAALFSTVLSPR